MEVPPAGSARGNFQKKIDDLDRFLLLKNIEFHLVKACTLLAKKLDRKPFKVPINCHGVSFVWEVNIDTSLINLYIEEFRNVGIEFVTRTSISGQTLR